MAQQMAWQETDRYQSNMSEAQALISGFCQTSAIPCLIKIHDYSSRLVKLFWTMVLLGGTAACAWHCSLLVTKYLEYNVQTSISIINQRVIEFPSVTICNMNPLKASKLKGTRFDKLLELDQSFEKSQTATTTAAGKRRRDVLAELERQVGERKRRDFGDTGIDMSFFDSSIWDAFVPADNPLDIAVPSLNWPGIDTSGSTTTRSMGMLPDSSLDFGSIASLEDAFNSMLIQANFSYFKAFAHDANDVVGLMKGSQTNDFSDVLAVIRPTPDEVKAYGHLSSDLIQQCTFDAVDCSSWTWYPIPNQKYGMCYTFNHGVNTKLIKTNRFGSQYGLKLTLDPEVDEYVGLFSPTVGIRVVIHPSNIRPYPEQNGIDAATSFSTQIGIRKNVINRFKDYTGCIDAVDPSDGSDNGTPTKTYSYSLLNCMDDCLQNKMNETCSCWDRFSGESDDTPRCSYFSDTQSACRDGVYSDFDQGKIDCDCSLPCTDVYFSTIVSSSRWPSPRYSRILAKKLRNYPANGTKQLTHVHVYFEELNYQSIDESSAYELRNLFADLGGILGLYIGFSVCGLVEFLEIAVIIIQLLFVPMKTHRTAPMTNS